MVFALRFGLCAVAGLLVGLLIGGLAVTWKLGLPLNTGDPLTLLTGFPGWPEVTEAPWSTGWPIVGVSSAAFTALALLLSITARLTEYGQAHFQSRAEMKRNGLLKPLGAGLIFGKLGTPASRKPFVAAEFAKFPHCLVVAPTRAGKGVGYVIPNTLLFPGNAVILDVKGEIFDATAAPPGAG